MQMQMFDPRQTPTATAEMLADRGLREAIASMRRECEILDYTWPYVEAIGEVGGSSAWAIEDDGVRYVVVGRVVFELDDLEILNRTIQAAARGAFARLGAGVA